MLDQYGPVIGEITPCLLMSPHSAAWFLPPDAIDIDLVVYDEASQIKVAKAIGAMGRAKSVVIVGDSKQMPPSVFGERYVGPQIPICWSFLDSVDHAAALEDLAKWLDWLTARFEPDQRTIPACRRVQDRSSRSSARCTPR